MRFNLQYPQLRYNKSRTGFSLIEVISVVIISSIITLTLGVVYIYFVDSWNRAQADIELYEASASLYRILYFGLDEYGGGSEGGLSVKWAKKVEIGKYKQCDCPQREQGNLINVICPSGEITFYHNPKDSVFYCMYEGDKIPLIPSKYAWGGDVEENNYTMKREVWVEYVCFSMKDDKDDLLYISYALRNKYRERVEFNSAIFLRNAR